MKKSLIAVVLVMFSAVFNLSAQKILTVDMDLIKKNIEDKQSAYYYPTLISRFEAGDSTLTPEQFRHIYYGHSLMEGFSPYGEEEGMDKFWELYRNENYREALPIALKTLKEDPVNLTLTFKVLVCYHALKIKDSARLFARRYYPLLKVIHNSGDGFSIKTAMVVTSVDDEYEMLRANDMSSDGQALLEGPTDRLTIAKDKDGKEPEVKELYFNVAISFKKMEDLFKKDPPTLPESPRKKK